MVDYRHALFMLLLLCHILRKTRDEDPLSLYLVAGGLLLVFMPPAVAFEIPWNLVLALFLPLIFWQNARDWLHIDRRVPRSDIYIWLLAALSVLLIVALIGNQPWFMAIFLGIITASMLWQAAYRERISNPLGNIGSLTLAFLLVETSLAWDVPIYFPGSLFSGAGVGIGFALLSIVLCKKVSPKYESWVSLGQVYLAYWTALFISASAIAASLVSIVIFDEFHQSSLNVRQSNTASTILNHRYFNIVFLALFVFIAWQTHQPLALVQWLVVGLGLCSGFLVALLGRRIGLPQFERLNSTWHSTLQTGLFLLGTLILWPRGPKLMPVMIWIALGSAVFLPVLSIILVKALHVLETGSSENPPNSF